MRSLKLAVLITLSAALASTAEAQQQFKFVSGGTVTAFGYYVGPYVGATGPGYSQPITLNCVDFFHRISVGQTWTANMTRLGTAADLSATRFGGFTNGLTLYRQAAWLTTQYAGKSNYEIGQIQATIWNLFGGGPAPATSSWLTAAQQNYTSVNMRDFVVITDVNMGLANSTQEFITRDPVVTPEPVSMALLGTGLAGLAAVRRRRKKKPVEDPAEI